MVLHCCVWRADAKSIKFQVEQKCESQARNRTGINDQRVQREWTWLGRSRPKQTTPWAS
jgi:hypothetical protein